MKRRYYRIPDFPPPGPPPCERPCGKPPPPEDAHGKHPDGPPGHEGPKHHPFCGVDYPLVLIMAACLKEQGMEAALALEPFMPVNGQIAINSAIKVRENVAVMNEGARIRCIIDRAGRDPCRMGIGDALRAVAKCSYFKGKRGERLCAAAERHEHIRADADRIKKVLSGARNGNVPSDIFDVFMGDKASGTAKTITNMMSAGASPLSQLAGMMGEGASSPFSQLAGMMGQNGASSPLAQLVGMMGQNGALGAAAPLLNMMGMNKEQA